MLHSCSRSKKIPFTESKTCLMPTPWTKSFKDPLYTLSYRKVTQHLSFLFQSELKFVKFVKVNNDQRYDFALPIRRNRPQATTKETTSSLFSQHMYLDIWLIRRTWITSISEKSRSANQKHLEVEVFAYFWQAISCTVPVVLSYPVNDINDK